MRHRSGHASISATLSADATVALKGAGRERNSDVDAGLGLRISPSTRPREVGNISAVRLRDINFGDSYALSSAVTRIGRLPDNDMVVDDSKVHGHHAAIIAQTSGYLIADLRSPNGIRVNGECTKASSPLVDGAVIGIGGHEFVFNIRDEASR
jgi:Inner membrane component of T3SS, cytoplasmic domain